MNGYILMDGAMIHHAVSTSKWFASPSPMFAPLMPKTEQHLAGPILISEEVALELPNKAEILRLIDCYPRRLHIAFLQSSATLEELAQHLRHYVYFADDTGLAYGLRIGDSRVMAYLPQVLAPDQWDAITGPLARWAVHKREGETYELSLSESRLQRTQPPQPLRLTDEQVGRLMDEGEPDVLLHHIGKDVGLGEEKFALSRYEAACKCIRHWKASGSTDRRVLVDFLRQLFNEGTQYRNDEAFMHSLLGTAAANVR
ncbi:DUF4123 domain-containing protein [Variovorax sp. OV329]|uniref:DUF4123 domain-containing protein n=1 Tax=Variovorax sp. OV329 TaxID=1882825 RepID=UPI0008E9ADD4|nr:DUF4123 domain-containing protein [Variovorax sp. OV329]SFM41611.1 protein of unknown function [Variovorax sp. OV329]